MFSQSASLLCRDVVFHVHDLLTLRCEDDDAPPGLLNLLDEFSEDETLSRARTATKNGNRIC
jgi:hypothetical protein